MKNRKIIIGFCIIFLISFLTILINKKNNDYIMQDGVMLALTLDGEKITEYPEGINYGVEINCENGKGKWLVEEWKLAVEEINGNVVCNINFMSNPKTLINEVETVNVNNNYNSHGYRYSGKYPNNYIWFNNEMWRIIGSIPTCLSASCGTNTTNLIKIIRENPIGGYAYDAKSGSTYKGIWGSNTLYTLLNNSYFGAYNNTGSSFCYGWQVSAAANCDFRTKGIKPDGYYGKMVKKVYWNTGASNTYVASEIYNDEILIRTVTGNVGIMSASDYAYAADKSYHTTMTYEYSKTDIIDTNWIYGKGMEWTSTCLDTASNNAIVIPGTGSLTNGTPNIGNPIRPVVYLDSSVYVVSGDGSITNPYQIGMQ